MPLNEKELRQLCEQLVACEDEESAVRLAEQLRVAMHEHIEEVRDRLNALRPVA